MRRSAFVLALASLALAPLAGGAALAAQGNAAPTVVIIVRHADKAAQPANDPPLTEVGTERALALADFLKDAKVAAVMHTATTRTRETARPTFERFGLTPEIIPNGPAPVVAAAIREMVARHQGQTILVVGHSNTVMPWIAALGGPERPNLCDHQYDGLYTVIIGGGQTRLVEGRYGPPNPAPTAPCATMPPRP
jgi:broad specificity phosphatase PhoE